MMSINRNGKILHHNLGDPPRRKAPPRLVCTDAVRSGLQREAMRLGSLDEFAVIVGGESGPRARPCQLEWVESIRDQCFEADVPPFVKQLGAKSMDRGYRFPLKDSKGGDWNEWPKDLRVREMPATGSASLVGQTA